MKISREWLQEFFEAPLPDAAKLAEALTFHVFEIESVEGDVLDVKVTPNRGHDCLSYYGIAREISAILKIPFRGTAHTMQIGDLTKPTTAVAVTIAEPELCRRFMAAYVTGISVGPSPDWLKQRLERVGQRSINNIVDAANYVMFNTGQPLHTFDAAKLTEKDGTVAVAVRRARAGEKLVALDDEEYTLADSMLVIVDGHSDTPLGIAGVKGGQASGITEATKNLVIEAANFDGPSVRKTARALNLRTDASSRFEQVISPAKVPFGIRAVVELITQIAGGEFVGAVDVYPRPLVEKTVTVTHDHVNRLLGTALSGSDVEDVFTRLGFKYKGLRNPYIGYEVTVPPERLDLDIPEDLIEEVGRIVGYDHVPSVELPFDSAQGRPAENPTFAASERACEELMAQGYSEVYTSVFADKGERAVSNKIGGEKPYLRANLTDGLREAYDRNVRNKELFGLALVRLFEIGTVWVRGKEEICVGTADEKGVSEKLLDVSSTEKYIELPLSQTARYQPFSKYPFAVRDIALWTPKGTTSESVDTLIREHAGELLVRTDLFDRFEKGDRISYAFRLVFQSFDRTLADEDITSRMNSVSHALIEKGFEIR